MNYFRPKFPSLAIQCYSSFLNYSVFTVLRDFGHSPALTKLFSLTSKILLKSCEV